MLGGDELAEQVATWVFAQNAQSSTDHHTVLRWDKMDYNLSRRLASVLVTVDRGRRDRLQPLTRCMPCSSRTARSVQTLGFCVFQRRTVGHLQPWVEVWCGLFMIRARRIVKIVMRAGICTPHEPALRAVRYAHFSGTSRTCTMPPGSPLQESTFSSTALRLNVFLWGTCKAEVREVLSSL